MQTLSPQARTTAPGAYIHHQDAPTAVVGELVRRGVSGRVFHSQASGGLVEYALAGPEGEQVAFVDQRMELISEAVWQEYFLISSAGQGWQERLDGYGVQAALLSMDSQVPLIRAMEDASEWTRVQRDETHVLYVATESETATRWR